MIVWMELKNCRCEESPAITQDFIRRCFKLLPEHLCSTSHNEYMSKSTLEHQTFILILDHCLEDLFQQN